jgi:hypothetical protein
MAYSDFAPPAALQDLRIAGPWTGPVPITPTLLEKLKLLCHTDRELKAQGYVLQTPTREKIDAKLRCQKCGSAY